MAGALTAAIAAAFAGGVTPDPYFEYTTLLLPGNGTNGAQNNTFLDGSTNNFTITRNGNTTQGTFSPFSQTGWGGAFNTSTTYLTVTDTANLRFGSSNFTIEAWVYRNASGATQTIASKGASTPTGWVFQISSADKLVFTDTSTSITGTTSIAANTWTYVAVVRAGTGSNQTTIYVNGTSDGTGTSATNFNQTSNMLIGADRSSTNFANGYISNLRLSNTNRTISSTPTTALTVDANTIFLSLNLNRFQYTDSTAAYTNISVTGTPSVVAFSPFNPTASWSAATYGGSGYFDGNGDYLTVPNNAAFQLGTGDFTIECWYYPQDISLVAIFGLWGPSSSNTSWLMYLDGSGNPVWYTSTNGSTQTASLTSNKAITLNAWNHIVIERSSGTTTIYVNGASGGSTSTSINLYAATSQLTVGYNPVGGTPDNVYGYLSGLRIVKGSAVYTGAFTPPTAPPTAITNTSLLLTFTNAGIYDATSKNDLETVGNAQISNAVTPQFGSTSIKFNGTTDYLSAPDGPLFSLGSANFTIECWFRSGSFASGQFFVSQWNSASYGYAFSIANSTTVKFEYYSSGVYTSRSYTVPTFSTNTWYHIAWVRYNGTTTVYIDGVARGTPTSDNVSITDSTRPLLIGINGDGSNQYFDGYIQDLRITTGYARYTANFTPPTAAFPTL